MARALAQLSDSDPCRIRRRCSSAPSRARRRATRARLAPLLPGALGGRAEEAARVLARRGVVVGREVAEPELHGVAAVRRALEPELDRQIRAAERAMPDEVELRRLRRLRLGHRRVAARNEQARREVGLRRIDGGELLCGPRAADGHGIERRTVRLDVDPGRRRGAFRAEADAAHDDVEVAAGAARRGRLGLRGRAHARRGRRRGPSRRPGRGRCAAADRQGPERGGEVATRIASRIIGRRCCSRERPSQPGVRVASSSRSRQGARRA